MPKRAFITGITGQDGSYLTELLISKGYEVHGLLRQHRQKQKGYLHDLKLNSAQQKKQLFLHYGNLSESNSWDHLLKKIKPHEVYHLGGQSHIRVSFESPEYTFDVNALSTVRILECIRNLGEPIRFYHASSCDMYGCPKTFPQNENTPLRPVSPYACAKTASHFLTICYRMSYDLFACNGMLFNHESPRRGEIFVSRKIAQGVAAIKKGRQKKLRLGNLNVRKDWGYAPEYVEAMWRMLQHHKPDDYVIATGEAHSVQEFVEAAFQVVHLNWEEYVEVDPCQLRPSEVGLLVGNASKAKKILGWEPKVRFHKLVQIMVEAEMKNLSGS